MSTPPSSQPPMFDLLASPIDTLNRRRFLMLGAMVFVAGCAQERALTSLPEVPWPAHQPPPVTRPPVASPPAAAPASRPLVANALARSQWAKGQPVTSLMNPMLPVRYITLHHDGMEPFTGSSKSAAMDRLELIRRAHRGKGWGDIGYHFIIDRAGNVWEGRPIRWQGAHVKDHNEGNIGIMAMGNFDRQSPTQAQLSAVQKTIAQVARHYRLGSDRVRSHQEWASTACPGRNMQSAFVRMRSNRQLA